MFEIIYLGIPEPLSILQVAFVSKVGDLKDRFIGYRTLLNSELKKLVIIIIVPTVDDILIFYRFYHFRGICSAVPGEIKMTVTLIDFVCKPFL